MILLHIAYIFCVAPSTNEIVKLINMMRTSQKLVPLENNQSLNDVASHHADYMAETETVTYDLKDQSSLAQAIVNSGYGSPTTVNFVVEKFEPQASVKIKKIIQKNAKGGLLVDSVFRDIGVGVAKSASGSTFICFVLSRKNQPTANANKKSPQIKMNKKVVDAQSVSTLFDSSDKINENNFLIDNQIYHGKQQLLDDFENQSAENISDLNTKKTDPKVPYRGSISKKTQSDITPDSKMIKVDREETEPSKPEESEKKGNEEDKRAEEEKSVSVDEKKELQSTQDDKKKIDEQEKVDENENPNDGKKEKEKKTLRMKKISLMKRKKKNLGMIKISLKRI
ncbi:hypothetical protein EDEG_01240 [Edhazardia aedis USNM 41457]|uniref:SCP domain-containing protein n=1 Tax=Edhazardia aedis (strain USNM 41457) TaxID=1003232 RepID=J9DTG6_EDHAE|nr:hypothetical protein EDEG_01240 [Edhazardia aedis USNM 41457]|eukprot:EJW04557.1 hypothetical protein EDEG_01240 [Edhazardia aedis USNM 41457]